MHAEKQRAEQAANSNRPRERLNRAWQAALELFGKSPDPLVLTDVGGHIVGAHCHNAHASWARVGASLLDPLSLDQRALTLTILSDAVSPGLAHALDLQFPGRVPAEWFRVTACPVMAGDRTIGITWQFVSIDTRKREEERLRIAEELMVDAQGVSHIGTWTWDITEPQAEWSPELYAIYGLDETKHTPTYQDYLTRIHEDDVERVKAVTERVFRDHEPYSHDERIFRPDGEMRWLHTWARAVLDADGNLAKLVGVCQDITDRKVAEIALAERLEEVEHRLEDAENLHA